MAIWMLSNIDIGRSLKSRDSVPRWKFKNRAPTSFSPSPILWPPAISFELHAEMAEKIDLEKCTFRNFRSSLTLTLDRVEVTMVHICGRGLPTHQIRWKSEKLFVDVQTYGQTDTPEFQSTRSSPRRWPKNELYVQRLSIQLLLSSDTQYSNIGFNILKCIEINAVIVMETICLMLNRNCTNLGSARNMKRK